MWHVYRIHISDHIRLHRNKGARATFQMMIYLSSHFCIFNGSLASLVLINSAFTRTDGAEGWMMCFVPSGQPQSQSKRDLEDR